MKTKTTKRAKTVKAAKREVRTDELLKIAARLKDQIGKVDAGPSWRDKALAATMEPGYKGYIRSVQIQRDAGVMPGNTAYSLIAHFAELLAQERIDQDAELERISQAMQAIEKREGLQDNEYFRLDDPDTPEDYKALDAEFNRRMDAIIAAVLRENGEDKMAGRLLAEPDTFWLGSLLNLKRFVGEPIPGLDE